MEHLVLLQDKERAFHVKTNGDIVPIEPENGNDFSLKELQGYVGGYIGIHKTTDGRRLIVHDEGRLINLPPNHIATAYYEYDTIVGDTVICPDSMVL
jgi:hypothetical protein